MTKEKIINIPGIGPFEASSWYDQAPRAWNLIDALMFLHALLQSESDSALMDQ